MVEGCQVILNEAQGLWQGGHLTVQMFSEPSHRHEMLAVNVSATHRHVQICKCYRLHIILAFPQNM